MKKICVVTGTRAEYGLLYWLLKGIQDDPALELQLVVTGMHLSPQHGNTYQEIEKDGFRIDKKVEMLLASDSSTGITKAVGLGIIGLSDVFTELQPDYVLLLGDRFEILAAAVAACLNHFPLAHIHGGETTFGAYDEAIRHSITKMAQLHFASTETYRRRIIQLGEQPESVYNVGALSLENIQRLPLLSQSELEKELGFTFRKKNLLITFHPATLAHQAAEQQFNALLEALEELQDTRLIFTLPNADTGSYKLVQMLQAFVAKHSSNASLFTSMGMLRYLSTMQFVDAVVGNSSSGIVEAPSFKIGTINIGDRQEGRIRAASVLDCAPQKESILQAIDTLYSPEFQDKLKTVKSPFGAGDTSAAIIDVLKKTDAAGLMKKRFYDLQMPQNL